MFGVLCIYYRGLEEEVRRLSGPEPDNSAVDKIADIAANTILPEIKKTPVKYKQLLQDLQGQISQLKVSSSGNAVEERQTKILALLEAIIRVIRCS